MNSKLQPFRVFLYLAIILFAGSLSAQSPDLVVIDYNYAQKEDLEQKIPSNIAILNLSTGENPWLVIRKKLEKNPNLKNIHLFAESGYKSLLLGGIEYTKTLIEAENELSMLEGLYSGDNYQLLLYCCNLPSNEEGLNIIKTIGQRTYFNVAASTKCTTIFDNSFTFDFTTLNMPTANPIIVK